MFWTPSHHLLEREREGGKKYGTKKLRGRHSYIHNYIQKEGKMDRDGGLDVKSLKEAGSWLSKAADYKNSHHIAYPHLHRCSVSAIPV